MSERVKSQLQEDYDVSRETLDHLTYFAEMLVKWTARINLVAKSTLTDLWERHILDSAQIWTEIPKDARILADLGSGGGLPGLVLAIIAKEKNPNLQFNLVESDARKGAFLRTIMRDLDLNLVVSTARIEALQFSRADVVTARALASLDTLLSYSERYLTKDGVCLFLKGAAHGSEITEARGNWRFDVTAIQSQTSPDAALLKIERLQRSHAE